MKVKEKWLVMAKKADFYQLGKLYGIDPVIARIIRNRNLTTISQFDMYLKGTLNELHDPVKLNDMDKATEIIYEAINSYKKIRVIGDYDIDGVCSGYILTNGIKELGGNVDFDVPERIKDGYGINERIVKQAFDDGVNLIITCDNGISASIPVDYCKNLGMDIVITDHHEIPYTIINGKKSYVIPNADAVIDPKRVDSTYPFADLCGAGVAFKVLQYLSSKFEIENRQEFIRKYLVFTAIATVGDIVDLQNENRIIVKYGLANIKSIGNLGLNALIEANNLMDKDISSYHIGFVIGPCINAGGRLDTAKLAYSLFCSENEETAKERAERLKELNDERKRMTIEYTKKAVEELEKQDIENKKIIVIYMKECHESLAGIIAGRIKDKYNKPVFVITDCENGAKGSGRSIEAYSMFEGLVMADSKEKVLKKYGGHKMAAGISIDREDIARFEKQINETCNLTADDFVRTVWVDVALPFEYINSNLIKQLKLLEPFGKANEKPCFAEKCIINRISVRGKNRNVIVLNLQNRSGKCIEGVLFEEEELFRKTILESVNESELDAAFMGKKNEINMSVIYYPEIDDYNGNDKIRVVIKQYSC